MKIKTTTGSEKLSIKSHEKWFDQVPKISSPKETHPEDVVLALSAEARNILDSETRLYNQMKEDRRDKDFVWVKRIVHSGTLSDKVSAHTMLVQDCPVYNVSSIENLINMVHTKGKRECLMAIDALQDLFINYLLAEDRKLKHFNEEPLGELSTLSKNMPQLRKRILVLWLFEDIVKSLYKKFVTNLSLVSHDTIEKTKQRALTVMCNLLKEHPEQEQFLLEHVVNKIGDPIAKVGSHVCYLLGHLLTQHPDMKSVVMQEVERLIFRPNLSDRAKYYALCFLNQVILSPEDFELANHLIMVYFGQFKLFVKKGEVNSKMMSALLTGVARAYPYAKLKENVLMEQLDAMYRLVHMVGFNISIQALMLIFQVLDSKDSLSDRFYCALYRKLFDPALGTSCRQASLLNLVYRALKKDVASVRVKAFVKRLLQISLYQAPNMQCGILILLSEVSKIHPSILESKHSFEPDSDSDEHYEDAPDDEPQDEEKVVKMEKGSEDSQERIGSSWFHRQSTKKRSKSSYDFHCRNPLHAGAEFSNVWELLFLRRCFHPSVSLFAHQLSHSKEIKYSGDPLLDFTTARFLDRFVYRNPKKQPEQQSVQARVFGGRKLKAKAPKLLPINSNEYIHQNTKNIPPEEQFIYRYLQKKGKTSKKNDDDIESVTSEDFQALLDNIHPEDEGKDSLNFAKELGLQKKRKVESESDDDEDESDLDEEEVDFGNDDSCKYDDVCEEDFIGLDTWSEKKSSKRRKVESLTDPSLMASAEEFSSLLEDNAGNRVDTITEQAFANRDRAGAKQIAWEVDRHQYVRGQRWKRKSNKRRQ